MTIMMLLNIRQHHETPDCRRRASRRLCSLLVGQFASPLDCWRLEAGLVSATKNGSINTPKTPLAIAGVTDDVLQWRCRRSTSFARGHHRNGSSRRTRLALSSPTSTCHPEPCAYATPSRTARSLRNVSASLLNRSISDPTADTSAEFDVSRPSARNSCLRCCLVSEETFPMRRSRWSSTMNCPAVLIP